MRTPDRLTALVVDVAIRRREDDGVAFSELRHDTTCSLHGRLGDGGRGATKRWGEAVCAKECVPFVIGVGRRLRGTRGLGGPEGPEASAAGCEPAEAARRA